MFKGSITAMVTPFSADGKKVDDEALERFVEFQIKNNTDALLPCGTTGEAMTLNHYEWSTVICKVMRVAAGRVPVIAGASSNNTAVMVELVKEAKNMGADGALVVTPYYNKPMQEGLYLHFKAAAEVGLPIIMYNVPGRTGVTITPETIVRLSKIPNIVAIKDATGSVDNMKAVLHDAPDFTILSGDDALTLPMRELGAKGVISVASNILPRQVAELASAPIEQARTMHLQLLDIFKALFYETNPIPVKESLGMMGMINPTLRLPLTPMGAATKEKLKSALKELGLIQEQGHENIGLSLQNSR